MRGWIDMIFPEMDALLMIGILLERSKNCECNGFWAGALYHFSLSCIKDFIAHIGNVVFYKRHFIHHYCRLGA